MSHSSDPRILVVEDNPAAARLLVEAFTESNIDEVEIVSSEESAMTFLHQSRPQQQFPVDLILLDFNLSKQSGLEVLSKLRSQESLKAIPVIMFSNEVQKEKIVSAYEQGANAYINKPDNYEQLLTLVHELEEFWFNTVQLPSQV